MLGEIKSIPIQQNIRKSLLLLGLLLCTIIGTADLVAQQQDQYIPILDPPGQFEIDGNLTAKDISNGIDWAPEWNGTTYLTGTNNYIFNPVDGTARDPNTSFFTKDPLESSTDDIFVGGLKYTDDPTDWRSKQAGASPGKGDMSTAFYHISRDGNGDQWLFVGSDRLKNNGTSYIDFEFFQGEVFHNPATNEFTTTNPNGKGRSEGDFLISVKYGNGGSDATVQFFIWRNNQFVEYTIASNAVAKGNTTLVRRPFTGSNASVYDAYLFVEAGLNMTSIFNGISEEFCDEIELESLLVKTKTSTSDNAQLIDFIGPVPIDITFGAAIISYDPNPVCENYGQFYEPTIEGVQNGSFSATPGGLAINSTTGVIDIAASAPGIYTITYTYDSYGCNDLISEYEVIIQSQPENPSTNVGYNAGDFTQCFTGQSLDANNAIEPVAGVSTVWYTSETGDTTTTSPTLSSPGTISYWAQAVSVDGGCVSEGRTEIVLQLKAKPEANNDSATTNEDEAVNIDVLANDTDLENDPITITSVSEPGHGKAEITANNQILYTPDANYFGTDTFTYTIDDGNCGSDTATVDITINSVNDLPSAMDDDLTVEEDSGAGLANQVDVSLNDNIGGDGGDADNFAITSQPDNGSVSEVSDGIFQYIPDANYNGTDSFTYTITDVNGDSATATVNITINSVNDVPVANDDNLIVAEDSSAGLSNQVNVAANDDIGGDGGDSDNYSIASLPSNGSITEISDGVFEYVPDPDYYGPDSFSYTITDVDGDTDTATVSITVNPVNDLPVAVNDELSVEEDSGAGAANQVNVAANDDIGGDGGDADNFAIATQPLYGSITEISDGIFEYIPDPDYNGPDSFTYTITDVDGDTDTATVSITVNSVNDLPNAEDDSLTVEEDSGAGVQNQVIVSANDDVGGDGGDGDDYAVATPPSNGSLTEISDGVFQYIPDPDFNGTDSFTYTITDVDGDTDTATVNITVNSVNDLPVAVNDNLAVDEDSQSGPANQVTVSANDYIGGDGGDGDDYALATPPSFGSVTEISDGVFEYIPNPDYNGPDSFTYTITDVDGDSDTATVSVTVNSVNDTPTAEDDSLVVEEDSQSGPDNRITVSANDLLRGDGGDGDDYALASPPSNGTVTEIVDGVFEYIPDPNFNGSDSFTYTITDADGDSVTATVNVTVTPINDLPVAVDDIASTDEDVAVVILVLDNDSDIDGDDLTITGTSNPANGTTSINADGTITYTPDQDYNGQDSFTYTISDGNGGTDTATVQVFIGIVNDPPVADNDAVTTPEDTAIDIDVTANDTDTDGDELEVFSVSDPENGTVVINADNTIKYTPDQDFNGQDSFTYTISDGNGGTDTATVTVTVTPVNDDPVAVNDPASTPEDQSVKINVLANDSDVDGDELSITSVTDPTNGTATINPDGTITYTPDPDYNGEDSFTYTISDGNGGTATATVTVNVTPVDDAPVAENDSLEVDEDSTAGIDNQIDVSQNDYIGGDGGDDDNFSIKTQPEHGTLTEISDGIFEYIPDPDYFGDDSFTYTITDIDGDTDSATVSITVTSVNDVPVAMDDNLSVEEDSGAGMANQVDVSVNDEIGGDGGDGDDYALATPPSHGTVTEISDGVFEYIPDPDYFGEDSFTYSLTDVNGDSSTATVNITVNSVNDNPVAENDTLIVDEDSTAGVDNQVDVSLNDYIGGDGGDDDNYSIATMPEHGSLTEISDGVFEYVPDPDYNGTDSFTYNLTDVNGDPVTATVNISVNSVDDLPVANDDSLTVDEDSTAGIANQVDVSANDDIGGDGGDDDNFTIAIQPENGTLTEITDGVFEYIPNPDFNGTDSFTYTITDVDGDVDTATVNITVNSVDDVPVANDDSLSVDEDSSSGLSNQVNVTLNDDLGGDGGDGDDYEIATQPMHGVVTEIEDGIFEYIPDPDYNGPDSFTYNIIDVDGNTSTATVSVTVNPVNDDPETENDIATTNENTPVDIPVLENDKDIDGDELVVIEVSDPPNGTTSINPDGSITYTPDPDFTGEDTFTYTVSDGNGGEDTGTVTVFVSDESGPQIVCPEADEVSNDEGICGAIYEFTLPEFSDNSGEASIEQIGGPASGEIFPVGPTTLIFRATDSSGNISICTYTVTVIDTEAPVITACAQDMMSVEADNGSCQASSVALEMPAVTDNCTAEEDLVITNDAPEVFELGQTIVTWTITDAAGNSSSCEQIVNVIDTQAPVITACAQDMMSVEADNGSCQASSVALEMPVFTDNCTAEEDLVITNDAPEVFELGQTIVTWTITDAAGNSSSCEQIVNVIDTQAPVITACAQDMMSVEADNGSCQASSVALEMPAVTDNCTAEEDLVITNDAPEVFELGQTIVTWTITDAAGNSSSCEQIVNVIDTQAPVITACAQDMMSVEADNGSCQASSVALEMPAVTDNCTVEEDLVITNDAPEVFELGQTIVTWTITDAAGNSSSCEQIVNVIDTQAPVITACAQDMMSVETDNGSCQASSVSLEMPVVNDNCTAGEDLVVTNDAPEVFELGQTIVTWTITDAAGNSSSCEQIVNVIDTQAPVITACAQDMMSVEADNGSCQASSVSLEMPVVNDNCTAGEDLVVTNDAPEVFELGQTIVTWTITDAAGNSSSCEQIINVIDTQAPVFEEVSDIPVNNDPGVCSAVVEYDIPLATDNCGLESIELTSGLAPGEDFPVGSTTVTYVATDTSGNTTTVSFEVIVTDNEAPTVECPESITINAEFGTEFIVVTYDQITVTDNCEGTTVELTQGIASGEEFPVGETTTIRYSITDAAGNNVECSFTVTVNENNPAPPSAPVASITAEATCANPTGTITVETREGLTYSVDGENYQESGVFENLEPGTYQVTARDEVGQISGVTSVTIEEPVASEIITTTANICVEDTAFDLFDFISGEDLDETGTWVDTDNTGALDSSFVDPTLLEVGSYTFTYEVEGNCPSTTELTVLINDDCVVLECSLIDLKESISKAVTPNGDNFNDFFTVDLDTECGFTYDLKIFNRWGAEVFTARNYQNNWDGFSKNSFTSSNQLPSGTYFYILEIRNSEFEPIQGYIYLGTK
ncbi:hypothetical protein GCM10023164_25780 [Christiangramia aestuarii]